MKVNKIEYIELYVANPLKTAVFYKSCFGFDILSCASPEKGLKDKISYILRCNDANLVISSSPDPNSEISSEIFKHDDFVKDVAFSVKNVEEIFQKSISNGALEVLKPTTITDGKNKIIKATVCVFGNVNHSFIEKISGEDLLPFYSSLSIKNDEISNLSDIDHVAIAVKQNEMDKLASFYQNTFCFHILYKEDIDFGSNGMRSVVVANESENIKLTILEPISKTQVSQIEKFIKNNNSKSGVQHIAFRTSNIIESVKRIKNNAINTLNVPLEYYESINTSIKKSLGESFYLSAKQLGILLDDDEDGQLLQVFTMPLQNRQTFFVEIIERRNSKSFGSKNIQALYKAVQGL